MRYIVVGKIPKVGLGNGHNKTPHLKRTVARGN